MGDLKNKTRKNVTMSVEHIQWLANYSEKTGIPITKILERFINAGIAAIDNIKIIPGRMPGSKRKGTEFLFEHWMWFETYQSQTGINPSKVLNAFIQYGIENMDDERV